MRWTFCSGGHENLISTETVERFEGPVDPAGFVQPPPPGTPPRHFVELSPDVSLGKGAIKALQPFPGYRHSSVF